MSSPKPTHLTDDEHRAHMESLQDEMHEKMRSAREKKGLIIVHTGNGKGKSTASFGMLTRMLAHGRKCAVIQFIKSSNDAVSTLLKGPNLAWHHVGDGFTWDTKNRAADIACCEEGWRLASSYMADTSIDFLLLDELNVVLALNYLPLERILAALRAKRTDLHVVLTGRDALPEVVALADLVTEMKEIKHPFSQGVQAQKGIEY